MDKSLIIVESPNKCATIEKYLGNDSFKVVASNGHITELKTNGKFGLGVNLETFEGQYQIDPKKAKLVKELIKVTKDYQTIYLATDPDREGEAISFHLMKVLKLQENTPRIEFHEITKNAILDAIQHQRTIDLNLVNSQETRRVLDRLIGFRLSKLMKAKTHTDSAGRVQSAVLKLVIDREEEIKAFVKEVSYSLSLVITINQDDYVIKIQKLQNKTFKNEKDDQHLKQVLTSILNGNKKVTVKEVLSKEVFEESKAPFITSTLQKAASKLFGFSPERTQAIAQKLFEKGYITYIRTDSTALSNDFINRASEYIKTRFGSEYLGKQKAVKNSASAQEAHEAIRPTANHNNPTSVKAALSNEEYKIYTIIYSRAIESLMKPISFMQTNVIFMDEFGNEYNLEGRKVTFDGYKRLHKEEKLSTDQKELDLDKYAIPAFEKGEEYTIKEGSVELHETKAPSNFTEAALIEEMEKLGIGRPSTYASTMKTLKQRKYVILEKKKLISTDMGQKNCHYLMTNFPTLVDSKYTSNMESELDGIAEGKLDRVKLLRDFWDRFEPKVEKMFKTDNEIELVGRKCPRCGGELIYKYSSKGKFIGCQNYPECTYTESLNLLNQTCPVCGKQLKIKTNRNKKYGDFIYCSGYPECKYSYNTNDGPPKILEEKCPKCEHLLLEKTSYDGTTIKFCSHCDYKDGEENKPKPQVIKKCPQCGGDLVIKHSTKRSGKAFLGCSNFPKCRHIEPYLEDNKK